MPNHRAGFVNIIGNPNVGKSTLMNLLIGENLSIVSHKIQTTRRTIRGIINEPDYQIVFSDTPGILKPTYLLQEKMLKFIETSLIDADIILFVTEAGEKFTQEDVLLKIKAAGVPVILVINKIDLIDQPKLEKIVAEWHERLNPEMIIPVSAKTKFNHQPIITGVLKYLPESPPYFPKEQISDLTERFFAAEKIREKIFHWYQQEIPYSVEVQIEEYKVLPEIIHINAIIFVERKSQAGILIGHQGESLKRVGTLARRDIELFNAKKVMLNLRVKVKEDWRNNPDTLKEFGYEG